MKKWWVIALCAMLAAGYCAGGQPDDMAYVISMAVDRADPDQIEISAQVPSIVEGDQDPGHVFMSAAGATFAEALDVLEASSQRRLNLTQIKTLILSRELAEGDGCADLLRDMLFTEQIFGDAHLVMALGSARELLAAQKAVIGMRLCHSVEAAVRHYQDHGYAPRATLSDVYFRLCATGSDPVAILAATADASHTRALPPGGMGRAWPGSLPRQGENANEYVGCALFAGGRAVGLMDGMEEELRGVLAGETGTVNRSLGGAWARLSLTRRKIRVDTAEDGPKIDIYLAFSMESGAVAPDRAVLCRQMEEEIISLIETCRSLGAEPFGFADIAARNFLTLPDWEAYGWRSRFPGASLRVKVEIG